MTVDAHLFRHASGRVVAALTRVFGVHNLELAEDVAQHAFCRALEVWKVRGYPENPEAWLLATAKHRAFDVLRRERNARRFAPEVERELERNAAPDLPLEAAFLPEAIRDEQLRMMFACCHPRLASEVQVALILNILCGFGAPEIAAAFLSSRAAIEKRISRGKQALREAQQLFALPPDELRLREASVARALYLLFNEGYHGASAANAVRPELCDEALRLVFLLLEHPPAQSPSLAALGSLLCLNAARLPARLTEDGELCSFRDQARNRWDRALLARGITLFQLSASGEDLSPYHIEAAIAVAHASAESYADTDWRTITSLYDRLLALSPSPVVALNRAIALAELEGPERGLAELGRLPNVERLAGSPFLDAARAELLLRLGDRDGACASFRAALALARSDVERRFFERRLCCCQP